jgi:hypothetical protein
LLENSSSCGYLRELKFGRDRAEPWGEPPGGAVGCAWWWSVWSTPCGSDETQADQQGAAQDARRSQNPPFAELGAVERADRQQRGG